MQPKPNKNGIARTLVSAQISASTLQRPPSGHVCIGQACSCQRWRHLPVNARRVLIVTALSLGLPAHALQVVQASDGTAVEAIVSQKEPTRIRIEGAPITDVFGNIESSHCAPSAPALAAPIAPVTPGMAAPAAAPAINPAGDVVVECDRDKGEIYIRPAGNSSKPINLFVSSANATYTLLLRQSDIPADTIVIRDKTPKALRPFALDRASDPALNPALSGPAPSSIRAMKALLVAMASDRVPPDVRVEETSRPISLWAEARFTLVRLYEGRELIGEKYLLLNISAAPMVLAEQEFDRPGSPGQGEVTGVAIEQHNLRPGDSTNVYVIRRGGAQ